MTLQVVYDEIDARVAQLADVSRGEGRWCAVVETRVNEAPPDAPFGNQDAIEARLHGPARTLREWLAEEPA